MTYTHHKVSSREDILSELAKVDKSSKEQFYLCELLQDIFYYFDQKQIYEYPNCIELFRSNGIKSAKLLETMILTFKSSIIEKKNNENFLMWLKKRALKKSNFTVKNLILSRIVMEHGPLFLDFLKTYLPQLNLKKEEIYAILLEIENLQFNKKEIHLEGQEKELFPVDIDNYSLNTFPESKSTIDMMEPTSMIEMMDSTSLDIFNNMYFIEFTHIHYFDDGDRFLV